MFGKHPAWDDFLWHGGDHSPALDTTMSLLYEEGVNRNIESAVWGDPANDLAAVVDRLDHYFLWGCAPDGYVVGRWWPSSDRTGRLRPLAACANCTDVACLTPFVHHALEVVDAFRQTADKAGSQEEMVAGLTDAQHELNQRLAQEWTEAPVPSGQWLKAAYPDHVKLQRILLATVRAAFPFIKLPPKNPFRRMRELVSHKLSSIVNGPDGPQTGMGKVRLPRAFCDEPAKLLVGWRRLLDRVGGNTLPACLLLPASMEWLDVLTGPLGARDDFRCLGIANLPVATDIAHEIPEEFAMAADKALDGGDFAVLPRALPADMVSG
jgi:hypothetical protein